LKFVLLVIKECEIASMDLVSIIIPTYNRAHLIAETIQSVLAQTHPHWELIIINDGSTDSTEEVIKSFDDSRIQYYYLDHGNGMIDRLRNFGMNKAKGKFITLLDSDDVLKPNKLEIQIRLLNKYPQAAFSICNAYEFTSTTVTSVDDIFVERNQSDEDVFVGHLFLPLLEGKYTAYLSVLFLRECIDKIGWMNENLKSCHGLEYLFRLLVNFEGIAINEKLMSIRRHDQNTSFNRSIASYEGTYEIMNMYASAGHIPEQLYRKIVDKLHYRSGLEYLKYNQGDNASEKFRLFLKSNPYHLKAWIRLVQSFSAGLLN
jgi:glycosyltransferase involved in cell wall biosynthesis